MTRQTVEMHLAYAWDCDQCGAENFERAVVHEFSPAELAEVAAEGGVEVAEQGNWMTHPEHVKCRACGSEFDAKHFREGGPDSDNEPGSDNDE